MPKVSIIVPAYNVERYVQKCVDSLLMQTYADLEIILVDDGSRDRTGSICDRMAEKDNRIVVIHNTTNQSLPTVRNIGLNIATGEYIMFADADDWLDREAVSAMLKAITSRNLDIVCSDYYETYPDREVRINQAGFNDNIACIRGMLTGSMHGSTCNKIYRRAFLAKTGTRLVDRANLFEDVGWNVRLFACTSKIGYLNNAFYHYVQNAEGSIIKSMSNPALSRLRALERIWNVDVASRFLKEKGLDRLLQHEMEAWQLEAKNGLLAENTFSLKRWIVTFPTADRAIWRSKKTTLNLKLLLTWLHLRCFFLYRLQKKLTASLSGKA